ncbi:aspartyl protease [Lutibacter oceani]|uniref:Aspartyl protease n=1 Tax=Lutibacter oceani TaxID=1853311 RepID=A0A3D9RQ45_9FLAO|nr:aspartyl protease [Lutibacter oceani]
MLLLFIIADSFAQNNFQFNSNVKRQTIPFQLLSNLIVFPIEVNGKKLNFILDSGVGNTILFNLNARDSVQLNNVKKIKLQGLGSEEPVDAILSDGNEFKLNNIISNSQKLYVVDNDNFDLSSKLGLTVNGIIGYELIKDFQVKINYSSKKITFYRPNDFNYDKCRKCESFDLEFYKYKPYMNIGAKLSQENDKITPIKLLIDSGGSDAMWLFEGSHPNILSPTNYFDDFLGEGLSGTIYGKRAKIKSLILGDFELKNPTVSYPDSLSIAHARKFNKRNGSIGASILKRFTVILDYKNEKITLKKGSHFKDPFRYNMSGIELVHNGKVLVKEHDNSNTGFALVNEASMSTNNKVILDYKYKFTFKPSYKIYKLRVNSPAYNAGLKEGDIVIKIDNKYTFNMDMDEIIGKFYQKENKRISIVVERNNQNYEYYFNLKDMLK